MTSLFPKRDLPLAVCNVPIYWRVDRLRARLSELACFEPKALFAVDICSNHDAECPPWPRHETLKDTVIEHTSASLEDFWSSLLWLVFSARRVLFFYLSSFLELLSLVVTIYLLAFLGNKHCSYTLSDRLPNLIAKVWSLLSSSTMTSPNSIRFHLTLNRFIERMLSNLFKAKMW